MANTSPILITAHIVRQPKLFKHRGSVLAKDGDGAKFSRSRRRWAAFVSHWGRDDHSFAMRRVVLHCPELRVLRNLMTQNRHETVATLVLRSARCFYSALKKSRPET